MLNHFKTLKLKEEQRTQNSSLMTNVALTLRKQPNKCSRRKPERTVLNYARGANVAINRLLINNSRLQYATRAP